MADFAVYEFCFEKYIQNEPK